MPNGDARKKITLEEVRLVSFAAFAAFITYLSMYAFRKPFLAGTFDGLSLWGIDYKILLIISQLVGYTLSKYVGIKVISELNQSSRTKTLLVLMGFAWIMLLLFAITPYPYNFPFMFLNGLPLGMIWGVVFSYVEGRRYTELVGAVMASSFILSSGIVKSLGRFMIDNFHVTEMWMPFLVALLFVPFLLLGIYMLSKIPHPDEQDIAIRTERIPMNNHQRMAFFLRFAPGFVLSILIYLALTVFRDLRDNFAVEFWKGLNFTNTPQLLIMTEIPIVLFVLVIISLMIMIRNNKMAFYSLFAILFLSGILLLVSTLLFSSNRLDPLSWMIISGFAMYLCYLIFNTVFFERWIAHYQVKSNIGFLIYVSDSIGYLGSTAVLLFKNFSNSKISWVEFFKISALCTSVIMIILSFFAFLYFKELDEKSILLEPVSIKL
jgi:MFS family permease